MGCGTCDVCTWRTVAMETKRQPPGRAAASLIHSRLIPPTRTSPAWPSIARRTGSASPSASGMLGAGSPAGADPASYTAFTWVAAFCQPSFISSPLRCRFSASPTAAAGSIPRLTAADATPAAASWYDGSPPSAGSAASSSALAAAALRIPVRRASTFRRSVAYSRRRR